MSKYTTEVRFICERAAGLTESTGGDDVESVLNRSWYYIFGESWPIFDEGHRADLCKSILRHYYLREIASETVGIWKIWLRQRMLEIMPKYNQMYKAVAADFDFLTDVDVYTDHDKTGSGSSNSGSNASNENTTNTVNHSVSSSEGTSKYSDTPQGTLSGLMDDSYLTSATVNNDSSSSDGNSDSTSKGSSSSKTDSSFSDKENTADHLYGKRGSMTYTQMMVEYREAAISVDQMIIDELKDLFMQIW